MINVKKLQGWLEAYYGTPQLTEADGAKYVTDGAPPPPNTQTHTHSPYTTEQKHCVLSPRTICHLPDLQVPKKQG